MSGIEIRIPATADYEVRRELLRKQATSKLSRLVDLRRKYQILEITNLALEQAADFWAILRQTGLPTAGDESLDADAILAGMALPIGIPGDRVTIATTNVKHLTRFPGIDAQVWDSIA